MLYPSLDISKGDSIRNFARDVTKQGKVDVLINNAGVNLDNEYGPENARRTLDVNYRGTLEVRIISQRLLPFPPICSGLELSLLP